MANLGVSCCTGVTHFIKQGVKQSDLGSRHRIRQEHDEAYDWSSADTFESADCCEGAWNPMPWQVIVVTPDGCSSISNFASVRCSATQIAVLLYRVS